MAKQSRKWFYQSQAWQSIRKQALHRDMYTCQICGARATEVHHLIELNDKNIHDPNISLNLNNLQSLCHDCHRHITMVEHGYIKEDCDEGYMFDSNGMLVKKDNYF